MNIKYLICLLSLALCCSIASHAADTPGKKPAKNSVTKQRKKKAKPPMDASEQSGEYQKYGIYHKTAPRAKEASAKVTNLPLEIAPKSRIAFIGNTLLDRSQHFGYLETLIQQKYPKHELIFRNLAWAADTPDLQPRPANFADLDQHLTHEKIDVIIAAYGFNESFEGEAGLQKFRTSLTELVKNLKSKAFNGKSAPQVILLSPIANENTSQVAAGDLNNVNIELYRDAMKAIAKEQQVGFVDIFDATLKEMNSKTGKESNSKSPETQLTINGVHLNDKGYRLFADIVYQQLFNEKAGSVQEPLRQAIIEKNQEYFRRYRPANTFYYTGGRSKQYGYLDFLPAMRNFDVMVANREKRIWDIAQGKPVSDVIDDSNVPPLPKAQEGRGANQWMSAKDELKSFKIDPRFDVTLFAGEEEFPDIAAPIQMRWDSQGRLWVSCSTTYPHVYPGNKANDKLVILEDTDQDGKADKSTVFADDLHIPLSFEFGDGGVYVSEMPDLTFLKDTDGDGKADLRTRVLTGFGTEDSHHSLHDFAWTPDGDLIFRESVFHHSQVETAYGPVRQQNSGWFRFDPSTQRLTSFGTYSSTNPWGVTFDDWGQHVASHPIYAQAFHSLDPPYPTQHPSPKGLRAYSGTCGQEFVDFSTFPDDLQGGYIKVRYKPTNRVEIHKWIENEFGYDEEYVSDIIFSSNLSFIPVDIRFGPRGAMYVCDWYNPVKGHAQYSLRDERRDRHSGRIWRITTKGKPLQDPPKIHNASIAELLDILKMPEYRYRYWAKRELRERSSSVIQANEVKEALNTWVKNLKRDDPRFRHHQVEALWLYRDLKELNQPLLQELLACDNHHARAAATHQLRHWHADLPNANQLLRKAITDPNGIVRMEAAIAASYYGSKEALEILLDVYKYPDDKHLAYAITCALGSHTLRPHWEGNAKYNIAKILQKAKGRSVLKEPTPTATEAQFDSQPNLKTVKIACVPERMQFTVKQFAVLKGQPVKLLFMNPDATDHNLVIVKPDALAEVGMAANNMAKDPANANSDFVPQSKSDLILQASPMIGPTRKTQVHVMRFHAPQEPGIYPYVCTFPGHWIVMNGIIVVANDLGEVESMLAKRKPTIVKEWKMEDFPELKLRTDENSLMLGMQAFVKAQCTQCHQVAGHGVPLGPDLCEVHKKYQGAKLLKQLLEPSTEIHEKYRSWQFLMEDGRVQSGVVVKEDDTHYHLMANMLTPMVITKLPKKEVDEKIASKISQMPNGLLNILTKQEIENLISYLQLEDKFKLHPEHETKK